MLIKGNGQTRPLHTVTARKKLGGLIPSQLYRALSIGAGRIAIGVRLVVLLGDYARSAIKKGIRYARVSWDILRGLAFVPGNVSVGAHIPNETSRIRKISGSNVLYFHRWSDWGRDNNSTGLSRSLSTSYEHYCHNQEILFHIDRGYHRWH